MAVLAGDGFLAGRDRSFRAAGQRVPIAARAPLALVAPAPSSADAVTSLESVVRALRGSNARSSAMSYLVHAALGVAIWFATVQVAARVVPVERRIQLVALGIPVVLAAVAIAWIATRPRPDVLMQSADLHLGLKERLSTAWARRAAHGAMDDLLRQDALQHALRDRLAPAFPLRIRRREGGGGRIRSAAPAGPGGPPKTLEHPLAPG